MFTDVFFYYFMISFVFAPITLIITIYYRLDHYKPKDIVQEMEINKK